MRCWKRLLVKQRRDKASTLQKTLAVKILAIKTLAIFRLAFLGFFVGFYQKYEPVPPFTGRSRSACLEEQHEGLSSPQPKLVG